ncbi:hypothetical protein ACFQBQ_02985 [Granulicella cerasi]|uniref:Uncharacterized protein n=1 Tax=Granulicella cerasi TaxID=741063 RepID=A0ABW1Z835_9BACT|nr:hypothetical protein [Granulicella cerasi]
MSHFRYLSFAVLALPLALPPTVKAQSPAPPQAKAKKDNDRTFHTAQLRHAKLREAQANVSSLDLFLGPGGADGQPKPPFTFIDEDKNGTNPKLNAKDATGQSWRVKLGPEARPEVVATRLLWAMGYFVEDDYVLPEATVSNLQMKRGKGEIAENGLIKDARFAHKPDGQKKAGIWEWKANPFFGKREFNGLRVMMALMNNWDLKDVNNAVFVDKDKHQQYLVVSDIGATFGGNAFNLPIANSKGNIEAYEKSGFIDKTHDGMVDFATPKAPGAALLKTGGTLVGEYFHRRGFDWIGNNIPVEDARWMGEQLGALSHQQLVDAFRAGHFPADEVDRYVIVVENRIAQLKHL